jgi:RNA polymerase sigma-70 factor (ECF subfamily)
MMGQGPLDRVVQQVRQLADGAGDRPSDRLLLERFARQADQSAFAELVARHGPMVLAVCRRVLGDVHEADDTFQATWLVLARKAGAVRWSDSVAGWLHAVAVRVASKARGQAARRHKLTRELAAMQPVAQASDKDSGELLALVQSELARLPEREREVLVLCYLEGKTNAEAAAELGCPVGSMSGRLARARERLRERLQARGHTVAPAVLPVLLASSPPAVSEALARGTVEAAALLASGKAVAGAVNPTVIALVEESLRELSMKYTRLVVMVGLITLAFAAGAGLLGYHALAGGRPDEAPKETPRAVARLEPAPRPAPARTFRSTLSLLVYQVVEGEAPKLLGTTGTAVGPNNKAVNIPAGAVWYVQPMFGFAAPRNVGPRGGRGNIGGRPGGGGFGFVGGGIEQKIGGGKIEQKIGGGAVIGIPPPGGGMPPGGGFRLQPEKLTGEPLKKLVAEMKRQSIPGLSLYHMPIEPNDLAHLAAVPGLQTLLMTGNSLSDEALGKLEKFRALRFLVLESTAVTDKGLAQLKEVKTLARLHLAGDKIDDKALQSVREVKGLKRLRLHGTKVTGDGLKALKSLPELETIELCGSFTDTDLKSLDELAGLKAVRIYQSNITDEGVERLARIKGLRSLTLDAHWDPSGPQASVSLGGFFGGGPGVGGIPGGVGGGAVIGGRGGPAPSDAKLQWMMLRKAVVPGAGLAGVGVLGGGGGVDVPAPQFTKEGLAKLAAAKELTELFVSNEKLTDADMATLGKLTGLEKLGVFAPEVNDKGLAELKGLKKLQSLDVRGTKVTTKAVPTLRGLVRLRLLWVPVAAADAKSRAKLTEWRRRLPRVTVKPALEMAAGPPLGGRKGPIGGFPRR